MSDNDRDTEFQRGFDETFAKAAAPEEARYIMVCHDCGTVLYRQRDSKYVKQARENNLNCTCSDEGSYRLIEDAKAD